MKANKIQSLIHTLRILDQSLAWYKDYGKVEIETAEDTIYVKMDLDEAHLVLSGMSDYDAKIVDSWGDIATITISIKDPQ